MNQPAEPSALKIGWSCKQLRYTAELRTKLTGAHVMTQYVLKRLNALKAKIGVRVGASPASIDDALSPTT